MGEGVGEGDSRESPLTSILSLGGERKYFGCHFKLIAWALKTKSLFPSLFLPPAGKTYQRESRVSRDLAKRGEGRFSNVYVNSILRPLIT
jgi:hypothetical protein